MGMDASRAKVYSAMVETMGKEAAEAMMEVMPPWDHAEVARKADLENLRVSLEAKIEGLRAEVKADIAELRAEFARLEMKVEGMKIDFNSGMDRMFAKLVLVMLTSIVGVAGLVLAAVGLT